MNTLINGIPIGNGNIFIDSGNLYISESGSTPIILKNINSELMDQIGDFLYFHGKNPEIAAFKIEFPDLKIHVIKTKIYFITDKMSIQIQALPSEIKKAGTWLRKQK